MCSLQLERKKNFPLKNGKAIEFLFITSFHLFRYLEFYFLNILLTGKLISLSESILYDRKFRFIHWLLLIEPEFNSHDLVDH